MSLNGCCAFGAWVLLPFAFSFAAQAQVICGPATLTIHADLCTEVGAEFDAEIHMTGSNIGVIGGQYFLEYSVTNLEVIWAAAADPPSPFRMTVFADACYPGIPECTPELIQNMEPCCARNGYIDLATGTEGMATARDNVLARMTFRVLKNDTEPFIRFRRANPVGHETVLSGFSFGIPPILVDPGPTSVDLRDIADFQNCFTGHDPDDPPPLGCRCSFDADADADVDELDYDVFQPKFIGPGSLGCG